MRKEWVCTRGLSELDVYPSIDRRFELRREKEGRRKFDFIGDHPDREQDSGRHGRREGRDRRSED